MPTVTTHSAIETKSLGETWAREVERGWVIGLTGELGAGKTQLVKGLAHGLGISSRVHSPTFTLVNEYDGGRLRLFHLDLYRLETREQILNAGLEEFLQPDGVTVVEWAERLNDESRIKDQASIRHLRWVKIEIVGEAERRIAYEDFGA
jgi:tRNA threonylcarbamoyladenosine biosynthesis protein TsaE